MGEIKSTLDLIMEKTRNLTLSAEEKRAFHEEEMHRKVKGLLQRYLDGQISGERVKEEVAGLKEGDRETAVRMMRRECAERLDPWEDNSAVLFLLKQAAGTDTGPIEQLLKEAREELERERADQCEALRVRYEARGISGSAVIPNPDADFEWRRRLSEKKAGVRDKVAVFVGPGPGDA